MSVLLDTTLQKPLDIGRAIYPQPVATACGYVLRARTFEQLLEATLKAAEVLSRYLGALALASYSSRSTDPTTVAFKPEQFKKALAFGDFVSLTDSIAGAKCDHPLRSGFNALDRRGKKPAAAERSTVTNLIKLLKVRNDRGHDLSGMNSTQAKAFIQKNGIVEAFLDALSSADLILQLPLYLIEDQRNTGGKVVARTLFLMGESYDPSPQVLRLATHVTFDGEPALSHGAKSSSIAPMLMWLPVTATGNTRLFIWDTIDDKTLKYRTLDGLDQEMNGDHHRRLCSFLTGAKTNPEDCSLSSGETILQWWLVRRKAIEESTLHEAGWIPWNSANYETLQWFAAQLTTDTNAIPKDVIQDKLLDGRDRLQPGEIEQFLLLFGEDQGVRALLTREMIDLRVRTKQGTRWSDRKESHSNVLVNLRLATEFIKTHVNVGNLSVEELKKTTGTPDYIAIREALVNLFIHQDYTDKQAAAQIDISPGTVTFSNPGYSLVERDKASSGSKSQSRNPLIARAIRLLGFAELAASGLREIKLAWAKAGRQPPHLASDEKTNSFTLVLDWRQTFQMDLPASVKIVVAERDEHPTAPTVTQPKTTDASDPAS
jgi:hypothetical protein